MLFPSFPQVSTSAVPPKPPPMSSLRCIWGRSIALVDNSGSTSGKRLKIAKDFIDKFLPENISFWNEKSSPPVPLDEAKWKSTGGTRPGCSYCRIPKEIDAIVFMTDGQIFDTSELAALAAGVGHVPVLFVLFSNSLLAGTPIEEINISVFMSHYSVAHTAAVCVDDGTGARILCAKGQWAETFFHLPDVTPSSVLRDYPYLDIDAFKAIPTVVMEKASGTVVHTGSGPVNIEEILGIDTRSDLVSAMGDTPPDSIKDIVRTIHAMGRMGELRNNLNRLLQSTNDVPGGQRDVHELVQRLAFSDPEALEEVRSEMARTSSAEHDNRDLTLFNQVYNLLMQVMHEVETCGNSATSLGRSNRANRAKSVGTRAELEELDWRNSPQVACVVSMEEGPGCLLLGSLEDTHSNTGDYALDQPLTAGQARRNAVFSAPCFLGMEDNIASRVESMGTHPLTRQVTSVCIPLVNLSTQKNRDAVYARLCEVFMGGRAMPHVWQIALSSMLAALETPAWEDIDRRNALEFMCHEILDNVVLPAGSRMCPGTRSLALGEAFEAVVGEEVVTQHCGVPEACVIARLLARFRPEFGKEYLKKCIQARIATCIPQTYRARLSQGHSAAYKAFVESICKTRSSSVSGKTVPIAGGEHALKSLEGILAPSDLDATTKFADQVLSPRERIIAPGHAAVVAATIRFITNPHISSSAAVDTVKNSSDVCRLEMAAGTAGEVPEDKCKFDLVSNRKESEFLAPFVTPNGPSVNFFTDPEEGVVINMVTGAPPNANEEELINHLREKRKEMMEKHYKTPPTGEVTRTSTCSSLHRAMSDHALRNSGLLDTPNAFVKTVVDHLIDRDSERAGNINGRSLEARAHALIPSLRSSMKRFPNCVWEPRVSLKARLRMEAALAGEEVPLPIKVDLAGEES